MDGATRLRRGQNRADSEGRLDSCVAAQGLSTQALQTPWSPRPGVRSRLEQVGPAIGGVKVKPVDRITSADVSPDGSWLVVRTTGRVAFHRAPISPRGAGARCSASTCTTSVSLAVRASRLEETGRCS